MEFHHLIISTYVLFYFALARGTYGHASLPDEDYWHAVLPNTPIPSAIQELLNPGVEINDLPMQINETQYPITLFPQHDLYPGKTMNVQFTKNPFAPSIAAIYWYLKVIKEKYTFEDVCVRAAVKGEERYCAKSLGALIDFVTSKLGKNIQVFSSSFVSKQFQEKYTVEGVQNLGNKAVICHRLKFQKIVLFCHEVNATTPFMVPLVAAAGGTKTHALAICHADTSVLNHTLIHQTLKFNPGTKPFCHFTGDTTMIWVPNSVVDNVYRNNIAI